MDQSKNWRPSYPGNCTIPTQPTTPLHTRPIRPTGPSRPKAPDSGWVTLGRWVLAAVVALGLSAEVEARAVKPDTVVAGRVVGVSDGDTVTLLTDDLV